MTYEVLARRRRPQTFDELTGQAHVLRPLVYALDSGNIPQAILFSGSRGVGKTTLARILTRCLNCEKGVNSKCCGECSSCVEVAENRHIDLLEIDAASRTQVDDMRSILESVNYAPARGPYKVYLIDEVHMLSNHSFNALLKTLEEPPEHIIFLLATTDPEKIPKTVLSRCLQFHLKNLGRAQLSELLRSTLAEEGVEYEEESVDLLAEAATGSARDLLTLAEQAIAHGQGKLVASEVAEMLGSLDPHVINKLLQRILKKESKEVLGELAQVVARDLDSAAVLAAMARQLHDAAMGHAIGAASGAVSTEKSEAQKGESEAEGSALVAMSTPETIQLLYQIVLTGKRDLPLAPEPSLGLQMTVLRMLHFAPGKLVDAGSGSGSAVAAKQSIAKKNDANVANGQDRQEAEKRTTEEAKPKTDATQSVTSQETTGSTLENPKDSGKSDSTPALNANSEHNAPAKPHNRGAATKTPTPVIQDSPADGQPVATKQVNGVAPATSLPNSATLSSNEPVARPKLGQHDEAANRELDALYTEFTSHPTFKELQNNLGGQVIRNSLRRV